LNLSRPIQGNLYPSVSYSYLNSSTSSWTALSLIASRSMGVTHYYGSLEAQMHRRLNDASDVRGNDTMIVNDLQLLWLWNSVSQLNTTTEAWRRRLSMYLQYPLVPHYPLKPISSPKRLVNAI